MLLGKFLVINVLNRSNVLCMGLVDIFLFLRKVQELSYRKQIARQLCRQYVEGIYRPKYYTVTLKSKIRSLETKPLDRSYTTSRVN